MAALSDEFLNFLRNDSAELANFVKVVKAFLEVHGDIPPGGATAEGVGPRDWKEGEKHPLQTVGIAQADLDALVEASAEADVVERFLSWARGALSGLMFGGL